MVTPGSDPLAPHLLLPTAKYIPNHSVAPTKTNMEVQGLRHRCRTVDIRSTHPCFWRPLPNTPCIGHRATLHRGYDQCNHDLEITQWVDGSQGPCKTHKPLGPSQGHPHRFGQTLAGSFLHQVCTPGTVIITLSNPMHGHQH